MRKKIYWLLFLWPFYLTSQPVFPEKGIVFNDAVVPKIYISIHPDSFQQLFIQENLLRDHEYPADFTWDDGQHTETIAKVGFRLRGKSSRFSAKKSFKIKFDHFGSGTFYGLEELNINGEHNDPSVIRSKLCWDLMRLAGVEAPRSNHVALYVNGQYMGLYMNVESIDKIYLKSRQKNPAGQLFKCNYGIDLVYRGNHAAQYPPEIYEPANNKSDPDYTSLIHFIQALNDTNNPDYRCNLEEVFDVDDYLKRLAIEILTGHWDNPVYNKNNAYLYFNPASGKYQLLSYDMDNTFGIDWFNINWAERNIFKWSKSGEQRPVYEMIKNVPEYKERLAFYIRRFSSAFFNPAFIQQHVNPLRNRIAPFRAEDPFASLDYGYSFSDFLKSYNSALGRHVKNGLYEYVTTRSASALDQAGVPEPAPIIAFPSVRNTRDTSEISFFIEKTGQTTAKVHYRLDEEDWQNHDVFDDGTGFDIQANDGRYHLKIPAAGHQSLTYYISATDENNRESRLPVCRFFDVSVGNNFLNGLIINEFMADNEKIFDNAGEAEDWIEIYNASSQDIWLGDKYLTDKADRPDKWKMPDITLGPGEFVLFWADEDQHQGPDHTNFKLSKEGEFIGIYESRNNIFIPVDTLYFGLTQTDVSYGRYPDGTGPVIRLSTVTPGYSNVVSVTTEEEKKWPVLYPNPSDDTVYIDLVSPPLSVQCFDANGNNVAVNWAYTFQKFSIDIRQWPSGVYRLQIQWNNQSRWWKMIKL